MYWQPLTVTGWLPVVRRSQPITGPLQNGRDPLSLRIDYVYMTAYVRNTSISLTIIILRRLSQNYTLLTNIALIKIVCAKCHAIWIIIRYYLPTNTTSYNRLMIGGKLCKFRFISEGNSLILRLRFVKQCKHVIFAYNFPLPPTLPTWALSRTKTIFYD